MASGVMDRTERLGEQRSTLRLAGNVPGLQNLGSSFLSLDTDGRVVRLDSVAKACTARSKLTCAQSLA